MEVAQRACNCQVYCEGNFGNKKKLEGSVSTDMNFNSLLLYRLRILAECKQVYSLPHSRNAIFSFLSVTRY